MKRMSLLLIMCLLICVCTSCGKTQKGNAVEETGESIVVNDANVEQNGEDSTEKPEESTESQQQSEEVVATIPHFEPTEEIVNANPEDMKIQIADMVFQSLMPIGEVIEIIESSDVEWEFEYYESAIVPKGSWIKIDVQFNGDLAFGIVAHNYTEETVTLANCYLGALAYTKGYPHASSNIGGVIPNENIIGDSIPMSDYVYFWGGFPASGEGYDYSTTKQFFSEREIKYTEYVEERGNHPGVWISFEAKTWNSAKFHDMTEGKASGLIFGPQYYFIFDQMTGELLETRMIMSDPIRYK